MTGANCSISRVSLRPSTSRTGSVAPGVRGRSGDPGWRADPVRLRAGGDGPGPTRAGGSRARYAHRLRWLGTPRSRRRPAFATARPSAGKGRASGVVGLHRGKRARRRGAVGGPAGHNSLDVRARPQRAVPERGCRRGSRLRPGRKRRDIRRSDRGTGLDPGIRRRGPRDGARPACRDGPGHVPAEAREPGADEFLSPSSTIGPQHGQQGGQSRCGQPRRRPQPNRAGESGRPERAPPDPALGQAPGSVSWPTGQTGPARRSRPSPGHDHDARRQGGRRHRFRSAEALRQAFSAQHGVPPMRYRASHGVRAHRGR